MQFDITTVGPVGISKQYDAVKPDRKQSIDNIPAVIITDLKDLQSRIAVNDGNIIKADINNVPIILIPITIVNAVKTAIIIL